LDGAPPFLVADAQYRPGVARHGFGVQKCDEAAGGRPREITCYVISGFADQCEAVRFASALTRLRPARERTGLPRRA
jgi:hypothetical protein